MPLSRPLEEQSGSSKPGKEIILDVDAGVYNPDSYTCILDTSIVDWDEQRRQCDAFAERAMKALPHLTKGDCTVWIILEGGKNSSTRIQNAWGGGAYIDFLRRHKLHSGSFSQYWIGPDIAIKGTPVTKKLPKRKANKKYVAKPKLSA